MADHVFFPLPAIPHIILGKLDCCLGLHYLVFVEKPNCIFLRVVSLWVCAYLEAVFVFHLQKTDTSLSLPHVKSSFSMARAGVMLCESAATSSSGWACVGLGLCVARILDRVWGGGRSSGG